MKPKILLLYVLLCSISAGGQMRLGRSAPAVKTPAPPARAEPAAQLPIRRVILYSNGVAYIERIRPLPPTFAATLVPEPDNRYFQNAVAVVVNGEKVGYLAPEISRHYFEPLRAAACMTRR